MTTAVRVLLVLAGVGMAAYGVTLITDFTPRDQLSIVIWAIAGLLVHGLEQASPTGVFFKSQTVESIVAAVAQFEAHRGSFDARACRENAERFSVERFAREVSASVERAWQQHLHAGEGRAPGDEGVARLSARSSAP